MDIEERQQLIEGILTQIRGINEEITKLSTLRMQLGSCVIAIDRNQQRWNQEYPYASFPSDCADCCA